MEQVLVAKVFINFICDSKISLDRETRDELLTLTNKQGYVFKDGERQKSTVKRGGLEDEENTDYKRARAECSTSASRPVETQQYKKIQNDLGRCDHCAKKQCLEAGQFLPTASKNIYLDAESAFKIRIRSDFPKSKLRKFFSKFLFNLCTCLDDDDVERIWQEKRGDPNEVKRFTKIANDHNLAVDANSLASPFF